MQQSKILTFFKPSNPNPKTLNSPELPDHAQTRQLSGDANPNLMVTYSRRNSASNLERNNEEDEDLGSKRIEERSDGLAKPSSKLDSVNKNLNKKRSYAQYHLELGQSNFLLHACSVCGLMYARGDEADENVHKAFHKDYYEGIQFKGWRSERVVSTPGSDENRILLVLNGDSATKKYKVNRVIKTMEKELGFSEDRLIHKLSKVYLFISSHRLVGCLVAEPIRTAHRVVSGPCERKNNDKRCSDAHLPILEVADKGSKGTNSAILHFGKIKFQREVAKSGNTSNNKKVDMWDTGALLCEEETLPAICGFKAVWVAPSKRRKRIASELLDAARETFCEGRRLETSHCAFSPPTSSGKALASNYSRSQSFLVYRDDDI